MRLIPNGLARFGGRGLRGVFMGRSPRSASCFSLEGGNRFNRVGLWCWGGNFREMFRARFCFDRRALVLSALGRCGVGFDRWVTWFRRRCGGELTFRVEPDRGVAAGWAALAVPDFLGPARDFLVGG